MKTQKITVKLLVAVLMIAMLLPCIAACSSGETAPEDFEQIWGNETSNNDSNNNGNQNSNQNNGGNNNQNNGQNDGQNTANTNNPNKGEEPEEEKYEISSIGEFHDGLAKIETSIGYGYIDTKGNVVINPEYTSAENFKNGLACVGKGGKYGYIDTKGNVVIDVIYDVASTYFEDIAIVEKDGVKQYINAEGTVIYTVTGKETALGNVSNGFFYVEEVEELLSGNVYSISYYNKNGKAFTFENDKSAWYSHCDFNQYGYAFVGIQNDGVYDVKMIDNTGAIMTGFFDGDESDNYKSFARTKSGDHYFSIASGPKNYGDDIYIDYETGTWWLAKATEIYGVSMYGDDYLGNGYYLGSLQSGMFSSKYTIVYKDELLLVLDDIPEFQEAYIKRVSLCNYDGTDCLWVQLESTGGVNFCTLIDMEGNVLITPTKEYDSFIVDRSVGISKEFDGSEFLSGICKVKSTENDLFGYIGLDGEWVIEPQYEIATDFYGEGDDAVAVVNNNTIINRKGEIVFTIAE